MKQINTIEMNITEFDKSEAIHVEYGFDKCHFNEPLTTLSKFAKAPDAFRQKQRKYRVVLTARQNEKLLKYLTKGCFHRERFGNPKEAEHLLAFSYGQNPDVNMELATITERINQRFPSLKIAVQWEIANILYERNPVLAQKINRIDLDYDKDYITTDELIDKFIEDVLPTGKIDKNLCIFIVAQAWHAPRCIETCEAKGLSVVGGDFSERFSCSDSQRWVRNAFSWVLKEGTK